LLSKEHFLIKKNWTAIYDLTQGACSGKNKKKLQKKRGGEGGVVLWAAPGSSKEIRENTFLRKIMGERKTGGAKKSNPRNAHLG